jgi:hypothetical protein
MKRPFVRKCASPRQTSGSFMVEFLVAFLLISIIAMTLTQISSDSLRYLSTSKNDLYASEVIDELFEQTYVLGYAAMSKYAGQTLELKLNKATSADAGPPFRAHPLLLDLAKYSWKPETISSANLSNTVINESGTTNVVSYSVGQVLNDSILITISFAWQDSYGSHKRTQQLTLFKDS